LDDPHTVYLDPERLSNLTESTSGMYGGLGIQIDVRDGWITIIAPLPGTPADRAGIVPGDRIVSVNGKSSEGWTADEAREALRGEPGTHVSLLIERPGVSGRLPFTVTRSDIHVRSVRHAMMLADHVGYVQLTIFSDSSEDELRDAIGSLVRQGMTTLVFDLRDNPGGLLEQGVDIAGMFLGKGQPIVAMRGRTAESAHEFVNPSGQLWPRLDLITLVNDHSASAAEIVAGALQDHDRSLIVGGTSYGKGSAQSLFPLGSGEGALKLTTARWYTPSGRSIQKARADSATDGSDEETDSNAAPERPLSQRREYHTDAGRTVYGGGGITPDLILASADSGNGMLAFWRMLGSDIPRFRDALTDYALSVKASKAVPSADFTVTPAMRDEFWRRLQARNVHQISRAQYDSATTQVNQLLGTEISRFSFGLDASFHRQLRSDRVITTALQLAAQATDQHALLSRAAEM
ncbi:MAG: S41 family peptidase, partial [Gemmatimonadaceae bacterium]